MHFLCCEYLIEILPEIEGLFKLYNKISYNSPVFSGKHLIFCSYDNSEASGFVLHANVFVLGFAQNKQYVLLVIVAYIFKWLET